MHQLRNIALLFFNLYLPAFYAAHIKDVVYQAEQMVAGRKNLLQAVPDLIFVVNMADCNRCKTYNCIHWRTDVMGHIGKERRFRLVGMLCLHQCILQCLRLLPLLLNLFRDFLAHNHDHDIIRIVILCHDEGLADTNLLASRRGTPIIHIYLCTPKLVTFFQIIHIYLCRIFLPGFLKYKRFPTLKTFGSLTRRLQPCPLQ